MYATKEKERKKKKEYRETHKEYYKEYKKKYRIEHAAELREASKQYLTNLTPEKRERARVRAREWYEKNKDRVKARGIERRLIAVYSITKEYFDELLVKQENKCAVCKKDFNFNDKACYPCVDHCHTSGNLRGLLCFKCNVGLGSFNDDVDRLRMAAEYLENPVIDKNL